MTYRDIVLKLLKTRGDIICVEQHLMSDFAEKNNTTENFSNWCDSHGIEFVKVQDEEPPKIHLKKKFNYENN
ncbi:MAG: hypothetical protein ACOC12_01745 [Bacteroidota bacterium]